MHRVINSIVAHLLGCNNLPGFKIKLLSLETVKAINRNFCARSTAAPRLAETGKEKKQKISRSPQSQNGVKDDGGFFLKATTLVNGELTKLYIV